MSIFYVTSYGADNTKGIYTINLDENNNKLSLVAHNLTDDYPSYGIIKNNNLYVSYKNASGEKTGGGVGSFSIEGEKLILNNNLASNGRSYTHLCVDDNDDLFVANYHAGSLASYKLNNNKIINKQSVIHRNDENTKKESHVHYVGFTPDNKYVYGVDLGQDKIALYTYENGTLEETDKQICLSDQTGPRHMIFSSDGKYAYLVNEINNTLMVFKYVDEVFTLIQMINTTPRHFSGVSYASGIHFSNSGNHLFLSNRGHDSIVLYRVNKSTGKVTLLYMVHTGKCPRDFNIIDDKYLIVGCQDDNRLEVLSFDEEKEELKKTSSTLEVCAPVCVVVR